MRVVNAVTYSVRKHFLFRWQLQCFNTSARMPLEPRGAVFRAVVALLLVAELRGELAEGARVKLVHYAMNEIASVRLCMVTKIDVHEAKGGRIGVPRRYDGSSCDDVRTLAVLKAHFSEPEPPPPPKAKR